MEDQYKNVVRMAELYNLLGDTLSKELFWARIRCDCEPSISNRESLPSLCSLIEKDELDFILSPGDTCRKFVRDGGKLILYGASITGRKVGEKLLQEGIDFHAYCARNHEKYRNGVNGKPVLPASYIFENQDECRILIAATNTAKEIFDVLTANNFPPDRIIFWLKPSTCENLLEHQYFDFPEFFPDGTAFVDAGCYDCATSKRFATWCDEKYSKIFAFEPDPKNYQQCRDIADSSGLRMRLIPAGLDEKEGAITFNADGNSSSRVVNIKSKKAEDLVTIQTVTLDGSVGDTIIGFIKMDIEGSEMNALYGAKKVILRDRPMLAISVYHKPGDVLAIMDSLHSLVPQYRFFLRHYSWDDSETVLYAAIPK